MSNKQHDIGVPGPQPMVYRRYGPLTRLAAEIYKAAHGSAPARSTIYNVLTGKLISEPVSAAIKQAMKHPEYRKWKREEKQRANLAVKIAEQQLERARARSEAA